MNMGLTSVERMILESVSKGQSEILALSKDCGLSIKICHNVLQALLLRGLVTNSGADYFISTRIPSETLHEINQKSSKQNEALELVEGVMRTESHQTHLRKVYMEEKDQKIFQALLKNLEQFIDGLDNSSPHLPTKNTQIVFWGIGQYGKSIQTLIGEN